jgi:hypothetical protein
VGDHKRSSQHREQLDVVGAIITTLPLSRHGSSSATNEALMSPPAPAMRSVLRLRACDPC